MPVHLSLIIMACDGKIAVDIYMTVDSFLFLESTVSYKPAVIL